MKKKKQTNKQTKQIKQKLKTKIFEYEEENAISYMGYLSQQAVPLINHQMADK